MAIMLNGDTVEIFKFKDTGIVSLCQEVADYIGTGDYLRDRVIPDSARFVEKNGTYNIVFERE